MGTTYFCRNVLIEGTRSLEAVLNSNLSFMAEMVPTVDDTTVILSTRKVVMLEVAL